MSEKSVQLERSHGSRKNWAVVWTAVSAVATSLAAAFSGWAAFETARSVSETAKSTRTTTVLEIVAEYAAPDMLGAMKDLRDWKSEHGLRFSEDFRSFLVRKDLSTAELERIQKTDADRRRISHFFGKLMILVQIGAIDEDTLSKWWSGDTYLYIRDVLAPLEEAKIEAEYQIGAITEDQKKSNDDQEKKFLEFCAHTMTWNTIPSNQSLPKPRRGR
jgi:hypothetical protein